AGGVTFCTGADYYDFSYNWVCGNISSGEDGGVAHLGFIYQGDIEHNSIVFNQSTNPTIPTNGGGLIIEGTPDTDPVCGTQPDQDCPPGLSDGTGPGLVINANLIQGNSADSGSGGGVRFQQVNGTEVSTFPSNPGMWYGVQFTNNIVINNVSGWDGAGLSLQDALKVNLINNTVAHNDSTASSGVLNSSLGAPLASAPAGDCTNAAGTASCPQPAGLVSIPNSTLLTTSLTGLTVSCPAGHPNCSGFSNPILYNNLFWQNRAFQIGVGGQGTGTQNQQNTVSLFNASYTPGSVGSPAGNQTSTGSCPAGSSYWDIGVRGDTGPSNHSSGLTLAPNYSVLTDAADYPGANNLGSDPSVVSQYCNGSRVPPESGGLGFDVPPGISDAVVPNPVFSLMPSATVDEGNNWINMSWGPLALSNASVAGGPYGNYGGGPAMANYSLNPGSPAMNWIPASESLPGSAAIPATDFFGNPRPDAARGNAVDVGAIEYQAVASVLNSISPNSGMRGTTVNVTLSGSHLTGTTSVNTNAANIIVSNVHVVSDSTVTATFNITAATSAGAKNVSVTTNSGITSNTVTFTVTSPPVPTLTSISPNSGLIGQSVPVTLRGTGLTTTTSVNPGAANINVSNVVIVSDTQVTATFNIGSGTALGVHNVSITTVGGTTSTLPFTVVGPIGVSPNSVAFGNWL
ncbi:MAG: IPT/TIG domain-containing protein, partial [Acidobacteria bacterium]|nr:IPT/TIG domain-containing protein [Acidobacteriota bacterium]